MALMAQTKWFSFTVVPLLNFADWYSEEYGSMLTGLVYGCIVTGSMQVICNPCIPSMSAVVDGSGSVSTYWMKNPAEHEAVLLTTVSVG